MRRRFSIALWVFILSLILTLNVSAVNCSVDAGMKVIPVDAPFVSLYTNPPDAPGYRDHVVSFNDDGSMTFDFSKGIDGRRFGFQPGSWYEWEALFYIENLESKTIRYKILNEGLKYIYVEDGVTGTKFVEDGENNDIWGEIKPAKPASIKIAFAIPPSASLEKIEGTLSIIFEREESQTPDNGKKSVKKKDQKKNNKPPDGDLIDRMPGYISLSDPVFLEFLEELILKYDYGLLESNPEHTPRVYYWNELVEKWIALATYPESEDSVKAVNDGEYKGWFNVFGVIQPTFTDVEDHWGEETSNRMNGLGILEGYPGEGLVRPAILDQHITRAEFVTLLYRLLNINPDIPILEAYEPETAKAHLKELYTDADDIPEWAASMIASAGKAGLIVDREGNFDANEKVTRLEAAIMVSNALKMLSNYQPVDLTKFKDAQDIPEWAKAALSENVLEGYPDSTLRPEDPMTRAEALTVLKRLFIIGMGL